MSTCPSEETLALLGSGYSTGQDAGLEAHIEECSSCRQKLERLIRDSSEGKPLETIKPPPLADFVVGGELGRGSFGVVFEAQQISMARPVAIKFFRNTVASPERVRKQWLREARANARVEHPNVVAIYDAGESEGWLFLVQQMVEGRSLKDRLETPLKPVVAARLMNGVAEGVAAIHAKGLKHLDLKPSNILLDFLPGGLWENATPRITDFGISRPIDEPSGTHSQAANLWGTPSYMAPEQAAGKPEEVGPSCDIYAIGATLYHLLTGRPPFQAATPFESVEQLLNDDPIAPRKLNRSIPLDLETICLACLKKDPSARYHGFAQEVADDLQRWLDGKPIKARPISKVEQLAKSCRRYPLVAALALGLILSIGFGLAGVAYMFDVADKERAQTKLERIAVQKSREETQQYGASIGDAIDRLGDFKADSIFNLMSTDKKSFRSFVDSYEECMNVLMKTKEWNPDRVIGLGRMERELAAAFNFMNDIAKARTMARSSIRHSEALWEETLVPSTRIALSKELAYACMVLAEFETSDGKLQSARDSFKKAVGYLTFSECKQEYFCLYSRIYFDLKALNRRWLEAGDGVSVAECTQLSIGLLKWVKTEGARNDDRPEPESLAQVEQSTRDWIVKRLPVEESTDPHGEQYNHCWCRGRWLLLGNNFFLENPDSRVGPKESAQQMVSLIRSLRPSSANCHRLLFEVVESIYIEAGILGRVDKI